jgi:hypothetical protein
MIIVVKAALPPTLTLPTTSWGERGSACDQRLRKPGQRSRPAPPATKERRGGYGWGAVEIRVQASSLAPASVQDEANDHRCGSGFAPHPYPPHHFVGGGGVRRGRVTCEADEGVWEFDDQKL